MSTVIYSTSDKNGAFAGLAYKPLTASSNDSSVKYSIGIYFTYDAFDEGGGGIGFSSCGSSGKKYPGYHSVRQRYILH